MRHCSALVLPPWLQTSPTQGTSLRQSQAWLSTATRPICKSSHEFLSQLSPVGEMTVAL